MVQAHFRYCFPRHPRDNAPHKDAKSRLRCPFRQGIRLLLEDGSRIVCRLSGTGTEGATLRLYVERYLKDGGKGNIDDVLAPLVHAARELVELHEKLGKDEPTIIT